METVTVVWVRCDGGKKPDGKDICEIKSTGLINSLEAVVREEAVIKDFRLAGRWPAQRKAWRGESMPHRET